MGNKTSRDSISASRTGETSRADTGGGGITAGRVVKGIFTTIGRFLATFLMIGIITGCMVACVMTVYIFQMLGEDHGVDLDKEKLGYSSTMLYLNPETGEYEELQKLYYTDNNRVWVSYDEISDPVKDAVVAVEDKRFWDNNRDPKTGHQGVDWVRTFGAFVNQFIPGASVGGGSTIHQQLIKNVTQDDDYRIDRKVREIFRALELNRNYSKEQVLESYLNVVPFGSGTNGIETAALTYFGKHASELNLPEAASIVGITQYPTKYNPFLYPEENKKRQEDVLFFMKEQGKITEEEYEKALAADLNFKREEYREGATVISTYFEDHVINQVIQDLMEEYKLTKQKAEDMLFRGGYQIYTTVDLNMQRQLEQLYLSPEENFPRVNNSTYPQSAAVIIDPNGKILATVGGTGDKTGNRMLNRATMSTRQPGSSIKPIGVYALAFQYNQVYWSSILDDHPIQEPGKPGSLWPTNYYGTYYGNVTVAKAVQISINTIPVKLAQKIGVQPIFDFMHNQLNMHNMVESAIIDGRPMSDVDLAPLALGALTNGVTPLEMAGAYQIYANGGTFTSPYCYTEVKDSSGNIILAADTEKRYVMDEATSVVMNKLLQTVVTAQGATGTTAKLNNMPTAGKTGTSDADVNQWFIGMTPYYVCAVWLGYDEEKRFNEYGQYVDNTIDYYGQGYPPPKLWKIIMEPLHEGLEAASFPESDQVVSRAYCTITGRLAGDGCPQASGWYKTQERAMPPTCGGTHVQVRPEGEEGESSGSQESGDSAGGASEGDGGGTDPLRVVEGEVVGGGDAPADNAFVDDDGE